MYTSLLTRQVNRYLKTTLITPELKDLLDAINRSYEHYERDHVLGKHSLEVSSDELHELATEVQNKEKFTRAILHAASDGILVINEKNEIEVCNPVAEEYLGLNKQCEALYGSPSLPSQEGLHEHTLTRADGSFLPVEISVSEITIAQKKLHIYIIRDITARKESENKIALAQQKERELQKELVLAARQAGMMQVATSVLHNVGNILTTVNTSVAMLRDLIVHSELKHLPKIMELIAQHKNDLPFYLTEDSQGKHLIDLLKGISNSWEEENKKRVDELAILEKNIQYIKNVIKVQQSMSGVVGIKERVDINLLLDELITMHTQELDRQNIKIIREYHPIKEVLLDRVRLLQILVNLLRNAIESFHNGKKKERTITIRTAIPEKNTVRIDITDNGCGIEKNNLVRVFSYAFTTKESGHGFGLHNSAILAKEMGGNLMAYSNGLDRGATFSLILSLQD